MLSMPTPLTLQPIAEYTTPKYPTRLQMAEKPDLLRVLPARWKIRALVAALGIMPIIALSGADQRQQPVIVGSTAPPPYISEEDANRVVTGDLKRYGLQFKPSATNYPDVVAHQEFDRTIRGKPSTSGTLLNTTTVDVQSTAVDAKHHVTLVYLPPVMEGEAGGQFRDGEAIVNSVRVSAYSISQSLHEQHPDQYFVVIRTGMGSAEYIRAQLTDFIAYLKAENVI